MRNEVLLTGLGTVGAQGSGAESLRQLLASSEPPSRLLSDIDRAAGYHLEAGARKAFLVDPARVREWLSPAEARRMSPPSKLAVAAARMALRDAGLGDAPAEERAGVVVATAFGPSSYSEGLLRQILLDGPESASPFLFTESVANAPAAQIAIAAQARGPSVTVCQREAGALLAVGQAAADVAAGRAPRLLAGAVDEMTPLLHSLLDRFGSLCAQRRAGHGGRPSLRPPPRRVPGRRGGDGPGAGDGRGGARARRAGGRPRARLGRARFDPTAPPAGWGTGHEAWPASLRRTLDRAGIPLERIDRIVSGASGSRGGDRLEARTLRGVWERPAAAAGAGAQGGDRRVRRRLPGRGGARGGRSAVRADRRIRGARPGGSASCRTMARRCRRPPPLLVTSLRRRRRGLVDRAGGRVNELRVAAVIPAYQAAPSVGAVARGALAVLPEVLVIDDGSTDGTAEEARRAGARVISHALNRGKGAALVHRLPRPLRPRLRRRDHARRRRPAPARGDPQAARRGRCEADLVLGVRDHLFARDEHGAPR